MWATQKTNEMHKAIAGTKLYGLRNPMAKLTVEQVRYIRQSRKQIKDLARELGIDRNAISRAKRRLSYIDVE